MCYHDKCLLCIPVQKGSLVWAIIMSVVTGLTLLVSIILGSLTASGAIFTTNINYQQDMNGIYQYNYDTYARKVKGGAAAGFFILAVTSLPGLVFAVLLCIGISRRRPGYVKAYFVYGVIVTALATLVAVVLLLVGFQTLSIFIVISCVIYSLFLVLVQKTYFDILEGNDGGMVFNHNLVKIDP